MLRNTMLFNYYFVVDHPVYSIAIGLGVSSLFNHSYDANATYRISIENKTISIYACKPIHKGEEITLNYNGSPNDQSPVYFAPGCEEQTTYQSIYHRCIEERKLYIKDVSGKGRGVFCNRPIAADSLIETSVLLIFPASNLALPVRRNSILLQ